MLEERKRGEGRGGSLPSRVLWREKKRREGTEPLPLGLCAGRTEGGGGRGHAPPSSVWPCGRKKEDREGRVALPASDFVRT